MVPPFPATTFAEVLTMRSPLLLPVMATPLTVSAVALMLVAVRRLLALVQVRPLLASKLLPVLYWI